MKDGAGMQIDIPKPKVTWLLSAKNGMPHLPYALLSIVAQSYKNAEILARDDGSTDGTLEELHRWIPSRMPGRVYAGPAWGAGASLAFLVNECTTELCAVMDADDVSHPDRVEKQVNYMVAHPNASALGTWVNIIGEDGIGTEQTWDCPTSDAQARWRTRWMSGLNHPSVMLRRSAVLAAGNYSNLPRSLDSELWIRLCITGEICNLPEPLLLYRRHDTSATGAITNFYPDQLTVARHAARHLFPGLSPEDALELWQVTHPNGLEVSGPVKAKHLFWLSRSAKRLARLCGKPDDYFQQAPLYKEQIYWLRRKLLRRWGFQKLLDLRHSLRSH